MTRKHFIAIAKALNDEGVTAQCISAIADVCEKTNPRFDREKFEKAAGCPQPSDWDALNEYVKDACSCSPIKRGGIDERH
jgi:hypothetical protein